jgi:hypothetical protein
MPKMCNFALHLCRFCRQSHGITAVTEKPGIRPIPRCDRRDGDVLCGLRLARLDRLHHRLKNLQAVCAAQT